MRVMRDHIAMARALPRHRDQHRLLVRTGRPGVRGRLRRGRPGRVPGPRAGAASDRVERLHRVRDADLHLHLGCRWSERWTRWTAKRCGRRRSGRPYRTLARRVQQLLGARELHARAPVGLAGRLLGAVDRLPARRRSRDRGCARPAAPPARRGSGRPARSAGRRRRSASSVLDRLLGVALVGADDAGGPALDPADDVVAAHRRPLVVENPARLVAGSCRPPRRRAAPRAALRGSRSSGTRCPQGSPRSSSVVQARSPLALVAQLVAADADALHLLRRPQIASGDTRKRSTMRRRLPSGSRPA